MQQAKGPCWFPGCPRKVRQPSLEVIRARAEEEGADLYDLVPMCRAHLRGAREKRSFQIYGRAPAALYFVLGHREVWKADTLLGRIPDERVEREGIRTETDLRKWLGRWWRESRAASEAVH